MKTNQQHYQEYTQILQKAMDIEKAVAVLRWDREVWMPKNGAKLRGQQIATLKGLEHEIRTSARLGEILQQLSEAQDLTPRQAKNVTLSWQDYQRKQKYSKAFVERTAKTTAEGMDAWRKAREANNYALFRPALKRIVDLRREECELLGYEVHPYDALLDIYAPKEKTENLNVLFADVRKQLVDFVKEIAPKPQSKDHWMFQHFEEQKQWDYGLNILKQMCYNLDAGRQDKSEHPFTTTFSPSDVRVTTRVEPNDFHEMLWGTIHEGGHALYNQGLTLEDYGLPTGSPISSAIHESQARLWENNVGRGLPFWRANYAELQGIFPENLANVSLQDFYKSMNVVRPTLIRVNADELTYHFHILVRFEIEKALMNGELEVENLDEVWVEKYKAYLGIDVPSDKMGILQDIHWSDGSFGYFPTYSLGSFYAAQFYAQAKKDITGLEESIEKGNMQPLLQWLRSNIHQHGRFYTAEELCVKITGEKLNFSYFMDYAKEKYGRIYGFNS